MKAQANVDLPFAIFAAIDLVVGTFQSLKDVFFDFEQVLA